MKNTTTARRKSGTLKKRQPLAMLTTAKTNDRAETEEVSAMLCEMRERLGFTVLADRL